MCKLARGMFITLGRHTVTQAIRAIGEEEKDWTAWYDLFDGERFRADDLFAELIRQATNLTCHRSWTLAIFDGRHGSRRRRPGLTRLRRSCWAG